MPTEVLPEAAGVGDVAAAVADRDAMRRALARLSRQQRAVVVLRYAEDLSIEETAARVIRLVEQRRNEAGVKEPAPAR